LVFGVLALVVVVAVGVGSFWYFNRDQPTVIEVDGKRITNAASVLDRAQDEFATLVEADGAAPADGAGCWFAPPATRAETFLGPRIACGPVLLGVSGTTRPWVIGRAEYSTSTNGDTATGSFVAFEATAHPDTDDLLHPDDREVPATTGLEPATAGIRASDGRRLIGDQRAIENADRSFAASADEADASVVDGSACFFGGRRNEPGQFLADGSIWCGPVLLGDSTPDAPWATTTFEVAPGDSFALADATPPPFFEVTATVPLEPGIELARPDGRSVPDASGLQLPDAAPIESGAALVVTELPGEVELSGVEDGRLVIPSRSVHFTGLGRADRVGAGPKALIPPEGENLVVATFEAAAVPGGPSELGTAVLVVDGAERPFEGWADVDGSGSLVVSVPADAEEVALQVRFDGVTQRISLATGVRAEGFPPVLYRSKPTVTMGSSLAANAAMPAGDPAGAGGTVTEVRLVGWLEGRGWAPPGKAFLVPVLADWKTTPPCCEVTGVEIVPEFVVVPTDGERKEAFDDDSPSQPDPVFEVAADFTRGTIEMRLLVNFQYDGRPDSAQGEPTKLTIDIPA
jgi:hypothetical protein